MPILSLFSRKTAATSARVHPITSSEERRLSNERKATVATTNAWQEPKKSGLFIVKNGIRTSYGGKSKKTKKAKK